MPELPEVETVCSYLQRHLPGQTILSVKTSGLPLRQPIPNDFNDKLNNRVIQQVSRSAKYCQLALDTGDIILIHLGMSGKLILGEVAKPQKHDHVCLTLTNNQQLVFHDPRRFGLVTLYNPSVSIPSQLQNNGPEPLTNDFNATYLCGALANRSQSIKNSIMENKIVVGVGNIYACESLFKAKIAPWLPSNQLTKQQAKELVSAIVTTLKLAIKAGGSSISDFRQSSGELGYFQHQFLVYQREGESCKTCDTPIERLVQSGRSTFYCPACQD